MQSDPHYINSLLRNMRLRGEQSISQGNFHPTANPNLKPTEAFQCRVHVNHNYSESFCTTGSQKHVNLEIRGACMFNRMSCKTREQLFSYPHLPFT